MNSSVSEATAHTSPAGSDSDSREPSRLAKNSKTGRRTSLGLQAAARALVFLQSSEELHDGLGMLAKDRYIKY